MGSSGYGVQALTADWLNGGGGLHGAAAAWLVDM